MPALKLILKSSLNYPSVMGGFLGASILKAITTGFDRAIFATSAGTGFVSILQASAPVRNQLLDGIYSLIAPFLVMIVCTATGLVLMLTGAWDEANLESTNMVVYAFEKGLNSAWGGYIVMLTLFHFALTTLLAWCYCGEKAMEFVFGCSSIFLFRYLFVALIPLGFFVPVEIVWALANLTISFMLISNMIGVLCLSSEVIEESSQFFLTILNKSKTRPAQGRED